MEDVETIPSESVSSSMTFVTSNIEDSVKVIVVEYPSPWSIVVVNE